MTDTWPQGDINALTDTSIPAATVFAGGLMHKPITEMAVDAEKRLASFWYMKAEEPLPGDVNGDGEVTVADVNAVITGILNGSVDMTCDVNGDGEVTIADVNAVITIILTMPE